ncbi:HYR domain-containing protein [Myxococcus qinghaiensis]|uniref:HYR domain-containing protein n=1 Tax=Myxococcus qinghaiensis TaxID=2906758 RepID=UPI0020A6F9F1|nr:HYR domain-containing protein [Myxococcus qinghaiensis]MCP3162000.1 HYR domain-containing protein [Myxococcus qinghaiensis]
MNFQTAPVVGRWWLLGLLGVLPGCTGREPAAPETAQAPVVAGAQALVTPVRMADMTPYTVVAHTGPRALTAMDGYVLFFGENSRTLYRSDGTPEGTRMLRTVAWREEPFGIDNYGWQSPPRLAVVGKQAWWRGPEGLWTTDGTPEGTRLVGNLDFPEPLPPPVAFGGALYFSLGKRLYRSDGTVQGTRELAQVALKDFSVTPAQEVGSRSFFACESESSGVELCVTDGTPEGTTVAVDLVPGAGSGAPRILGAVADKVLFSASLGATGSPRRLYVSDGSAVGTELLSDTASLGDTAEPAGTGLAQSPTLLDGVAFFPCRSDVTGHELCRTDGTAEGTAILDLVPGTASSAPGRPRVLAGKLVFQGCSPEYVNCGLWSSTGTVGGSEVFWSAEPLQGFGMRSSLLAAGNSLFFHGGVGSGPGGLWKTDGTQAGTGLLLQPLTTLEGFIAVDANRDWVSLGDKLLFSGTQGPLGLELYVSDGTQEGTHLVADLTPRRGMGRAIELLSVEERLFVTAHGVGQQKLVRMDGSLPVRDLHSPTNSLNNWIRMAPLQGQVLLSTASGLLATDSSDQGIHPVSGGPTSVTRLVPAGDKVFLLGRDLWRADGTQAGAFQLSDAPPEVYEGAYVNGRLWFSSRRSEEPWTTTGELGSTKLLKDLNGGFSSSPRGFTGLGSLTFFSATDEEAGRELWKSDGTSDGTVRVADLRPGPLDASPEQLFAWKDHVYFWATGAEGATTLWKTDGTEAGTVSLQAATLRRAGAYGIENTDFVAWGDALFFAGADSQGGRELWRTDGTEAGTVRVADLMPGIDSSHPNALLLASPEGPLVFTALGPATGRELWRLDSPTGTPTLLAEMIEGARGSNPNQPTMVGSTLYVHADSGQGMAIFKLAGLIPDTFAPRVSCPLPREVPATGVGGAEVSFEDATAYDDSGAVLTLDSSHESGASFPGGITEVTFTARDAAGNEGTCSFNITVTGTPQPDAGAPESDAGSSAPDAGAPPPEPPSDDSGCGCTSGTATLPWALALFGLLGLSRRQGRGC